MEITSLSQLDLSKTYSYADYLKWEFQDRLELIKGKIFRMSPAPATRHQQISSKISNRLWNFLEYKQCQVFVAPFDVRLPIKSKKNADVGTVVQPDICVICDLNKIHHIITDKNAPAHIIEMMREREIEVTLV